MSNQLRKFRRKEQKEWSYEQYKKGKYAQQKNARIKEAQKDFIESYKKLLPHIIPTWQTKIALLFPPRWYNDFICYFLRIISSQENREMLLQLDMRWRKSFLRMFRFWLANLIYTVTIMSMLKFRTHINEFGIKLKIDTVHKDKKEYIRFRIFRFSKCFHEEEREL